MHACAVCFEQVQCDTLIPPRPSVNACVAVNSSFTALAAPSDFFLDCSWVETRLEERGSLELDMGM